MKRRCYCGQSKSFPLCDGRHTDLGWSCNYSDEVDPVILMSGSPRSYNLAQKAANHFQGISMLNARRLMFCETFVYFCDGSDYGHWLNFSEKVSAERKILVNMGHHLPHPGDEDWLVYSLSEDEIHPLIELDEIIKGRLNSLELETSKKIFISHSVDDEAQLENIVRSLRRYLGWEVFVCSDSIRSGPWFDQIKAELKNSNFQLFFISETTNRSVFCAFEAGLGLAWDKPIALVSLDGSKPPIYLQHLQMWDSVRLRQNKPWLNSEEILMDCVLKSVGSI